MKIHLFIFFSLLLFGLSGQTQEVSDTSIKSSPTIGFGVGAVKFYGDLHDKDYGSPMTGNPAFSIYLKQKITDFLAMRFTFMSAKIRGEERSIQRNINFETRLHSGAIYLDYNFDHFLPEDRTIKPFISAGLEFIKFNPKTDLRDQYGEYYNYWSDGSIRNLSENADNAENAVLVQRDYNYETDIREAGYNPSVAYENSAFVVPVGIGVSIKLNDQFNFRLESMMHLTFTDFIDGVTPNSSERFVGEKKGNANNDHYLINSASLSYNFQKVAPGKPLEYQPTNKEDRVPVDLLASGNTEDYDNDGVIDLIDECPNSPEGMEVDSLGCPVDSDGDGIPDYLDADPYSKNPHLTNERGIEVTDEMIYESYLRFNDSTLKYAEVINRSFGEKKENASKYRVKVGQHRKNDIPQNIGKLLSIPDLNKMEDNNQVVYTVGNYASSSQARERATQMKNSGFEDVAILEKDKSGSYKDTKIKISKSKRKSMASIIKEEVVVFRVQLGAFENQPEKNYFDAVKNLITVKTDGLYRYMTGSFNNFNDAAKLKLQMVLKGYKGAFVVAYKGGERVTLQSVGVNVIDSDPLIGE